MAFTFFFRDVHIAGTHHEAAAPESHWPQQDTIWDAGCALGQESYSLAIMLAQSMGPFAFKTSRYVQPT